jgi:hypothetical protein
MYLPIVKEMSLVGSWLRQDCASQMSAEGLQGCEGCFWIWLSCTCAR